MDKPRFCFRLISWWLLGLVAATTAAEPAGQRAVQDPTEGNIAKMVARFLENSHYSHLPFDRDLSVKFFERYIDSLDPLHSLFLQTDIREFDQYRERLDEMILREGDTTPAHVIFDRFMVRVKQRAKFVEGLLTTNAFEFTGNDSYTPDRHDALRPKDLPEAQALWRQQLRFEFLQEKLSSSIVHLNANVAPAGPGEWLVRTTKPKPDGLGLWFGTNSTESAGLAAAARALTGVKIASAGSVFGAQGEKLGYLGLDSRTNLVVDLHHAMAPDGLTSVRLFDPSGLLRATLSVSGTNYAWVDLEKTNLESVVKTLRLRYARVARDDSQLGNDDVLQFFVNALAQVYDPHTDYMGHLQLEDFAMIMKLSLTGIGALLEETDDGYCKIRELYPGPAMKSKQVKVGDRIVAVGQVGDKHKALKDSARPDRGVGEQIKVDSSASGPGPDADMVDVVGMRLTKTVQMIRGPKGTTVKLVLIPADAGDDSIRKTVTLVRDEIKLEDKAAKAKLIEIPRPASSALRLGVIDLDSFYAEMGLDGGQTSQPKSTTVDVARILKKLMAEKVDGVILDLRRNGGGSLEEAITLTGLFIKQGPVVQVKNSVGDIMKMEKPLEKDRDFGVFYDGPLVVLTSRFSASASEILAGALQDYGRALIVGDSATHGKGTVQTIVSLAARMDQYHWVHSYDPGALKLTVKKFYRPSGVSTQLEGVRPDIVLPSVNNYAKLGEKALENALSCDTVPPAEFSKVNDVKPWLTALRKLANDRIASEQDFTYVREDIEAYKKMIADKSVSLNEAARRKEKIENEAKMEARLHEARLRKPTQNKVYDITLGNVDLPGLSVAGALTNAPGGPTAAAALDPLAHDDDDANTRPPAVDVGLEETERVLGDYLALRKSEAKALSLAK